MRKVALIIFFISAIGTVASEALSLQLGYLVSKPLIMLSLTTFYFLSVPPMARSRSAIMAMVCSFAGDIFLMKEDFFIAGLISFLLAHVFYIFTYRQHQSEESENALAGLQRIRLAFPVILAASGLVIILFPALADLKIPVIIYAAVLAAMVLNALFRFGKTSSVSFWLVFIGAVLFMASDSILAINKFLEPLPDAGIYIMLSYCAAQFLIVTGLIKHPQSEFSQA